MDNFKRNVALLSKELVKLERYEFFGNKDREVPEYIQLDTKNKVTKLVRIPKFSEIPYPTIMEPKLVIEYYSR